MWQLFDKDGRRTGKPYTARAGAVRRVQATGGDQTIAEVAPRIGLHNEAYKAADGDVCPVCGGDRVSASGLERAFRTVTMRADCNLCGATWRVLYRMVGPTDVDTSACTPPPPASDAGHD